MKMARVFSDQATRFTGAGVEVNRGGRGTHQGYHRISDRRGNLNCGDELHCSGEETEKRKLMRIPESFTVGSLSRAAYVALA